MKQNTATARNPLLRAAAAAVLLASLAAPAYVAAAGMSATGTAAPSDQKIEARITDLHDKLKITPDQESKWKDVTDVMRENTATMRPLIEARKANEATSTAVDDMKSYSEIASAHADGAKKFASAFEPLYNSLSDAQKKTADAMFRKHAHEEGHKMHGKSAPAEATP